MRRTARNSPSSRRTTASDFRRRRQRRARSAACWPPMPPARAASRPGRPAITYLGVTAVSGRGELFKSGGRVVKNVTGYDLSKGLAGSWGTLAVATEVTFKVLPRAETQSDGQCFGGLDEQGPRSAAMCAAMGSPWEVSSAAHLPAAACLRCAVRCRRSGRHAACALKASARRWTTARTKLVDMLKSRMAISISSNAEGYIRGRLDRQSGTPRHLTGEKPPLWRISVAPTAGSRCDCRKPWLDRRKPDYFLRLVRRPDLAAIRQTRHARHAPKRFAPLSAGLAAMPP